MKTKLEIKLDNLLRVSNYDNQSALDFCNSQKFDEIEFKKLNKDDLIQIISKACLAIEVLLKNNGELVKLLPMLTEFAQEAQAVKNRVLDDAYVRESFINKKALTENSSKGGHGKSAKYEPLKAHAEKLVNAKNWASRRNAALTIKPEILQLAKEKNIYLSEMQAEHTITGWLKDMGLPANIS